MLHFSSVLCHDAALAAVAARHAYQIKYLNGQKAKRRGVVLRSVLERLEGLRAVQRAVLLWLFPVVLSPSPAVALLGESVDASPDKTGPPFAV